MSWTWWVALWVPLSMLGGLILGPFASIGEWKRDPAENGDNRLASR